VSYLLVRTEKSCVINFHYKGLCSFNALYIDSEQSDEGQVMKKFECLKGKGKGEGNNGRKC
jgi:hypothetical protein